MSTPLISLDNVTVTLPPGRADGHPALCDVTLRVEVGEWLAVLGHNGAGKTTLLHTLAGLYPPAAGRRDIHRGDEPRAGLLVQEPDNQFVASSVRNELLLSVPPETSAEQREKRVHEATDRFELERFLDRNPHRLSGGEKQRLAFATVWLADPELMLLDEPTSYLDADRRNDCISFVRELSAKGTTVVWATLDPRDAAFAGRMVSVERGRLTETGASVLSGANMPTSAHTSPDRRSPVNAGIEAPAHANADTTTLAPRGADATALGRPDADTTALVSLADVGFGYGDTPVLQGVSLELCGGECIGVCGANGSGKSTLLEIMSGILEADHGSVRRVFKRPVEDGVQQVFHLFQNAERMFFAETISEEIAFGLKALGVKGDERTERIDAALRTVHLDPAIYLDRSPFQLSGGEKRRVTLAIVYALQPRVLMMDEPMSGLDADGRLVLSEMIASLRGDGCALAVASHERDALADFTGDIVAL